MCFDWTQFPWIKFHPQVSPWGFPANWSSRDEINANSSLFQWQVQCGQWMAVCGISTGTTLDFSMWNLLAQDIHLPVSHITECFAAWGFLEERRNPSLFAIGRNRHPQRPHTEKSTGWLTDRWYPFRHRWGPWFRLGCFVLWEPWQPLLNPLTWIELWKNIGPIHGLVSLIATMYVCDAGDFRCTK